MIHFLQTNNAHTSRMNLQSQIQLSICSCIYSYATALSSAITISAQRFSKRSTSLSVLEGSDGGFRTPATYQAQLKQGLSFLTSSYARDLL